MPSPPSPEVRGRFCPTDTTYRHAACQPCHPLPSPNSTKRQNPAASLSVCGSPSPPPPPLPFPLLLLLLLLLSWGVERCLPAMPAKQQWWHVHGGGEMVWWHAGAGGRWWMEGLAWARVSQGRRGKFFLKMPV